MLCKCVIDAGGYFKEYVVVSGEGQVEGYELLPDDQLINAETPGGFICPRWDFDSQAWTESATPEEITAWEQEHPAPTSPESTPTPEQRISAIESAVLSLMEVQNV